MIMKKLLLKIARLPWLGALVGWMIAHLSRVLPLRVVADDPCCIAFHHPAPSYAVHLLIMPKTRVRDIARADSTLLNHILETARAAVETLNLAAPHIMLWTNGGRFQEVRQLHFHLFPSDLNREAGLRRLSRFSIGKTEICECIRGDGAAVNLLLLDGDSAEFPAVFSQLLERYDLETRGYSVFRDLSPVTDRSDRIYIRIG